MSIHVKGRGTKGSEHRAYAVDDGRIIRAVRLPVETDGVCQGCAKEAVLGDGLCVCCYDGRLEEYGDRPYGRRDKLGE